MYTNSEANACLPLLVMSLTCFMSQHQETGILPYQKYFKKPEYLIRTRLAEVCAQVFIIKINLGSYDTYDG